MSEGRYVDHQLDRVRCQAAIELGKYSIKTNDYKVATYLLQINIFEFGLYSHLFVKCLKELYLGNFPGAKEKLLQLANENDFDHLIADRAKELLSGHDWGQDDWEKKKKNIW